MFGSVHWEQVVPETVQNLSRLIQIDTTNPPGNELPAILAVKDILLGEGISEERKARLFPARLPKADTARCPAPNSSHPWR